MSRGILGVCAVLAVEIGALAGAGSALADTSVSSNITTNTTWTTSGSPYVLMAASISVSTGVTLTIQPGVTVEFNGGSSAKLNVNGTINALGTSASPILFTSYQDVHGGGGAAGQYTGIWITNLATTTSQFSYVTMRYGGNGASDATAAELQVGNGTANIDHVDLEYSQRAGLLVSGNKTATVTDSAFAHDHDGAYIYNDRADISTSTLSHNTRAGLELTVVSSTVHGATVDQNDITDNGQFGIYLNESCSNPTSSFPHGERNNIYSNGPNPTYSPQLVTTNVCHAIAVDWKNNYWGDAELDPGEALHSGGQNCPVDIAAAPSVYQPGGYLAMSDQPLPGDGTARLGAISASYQAQDLGPCNPPIDYEHVYLLHMWNSFFIGAGDFQASYMNRHVPMPTAADLYGGLSDGAVESTPNLLKCPICGHPVNSATGNFYEDATDLVIPGLSGSLSFTRTYNSQAAASAPSAGPLGYGWTFRFGDTLTVDANSGHATVTGRAGNTVRFYQNADGTYYAPAWVQATLVHNADGTYTDTLPDREVESFSSSGQLSSEKDRNGNTITLSYTGGKLSTVTDPSGRTLSFTYNTAGLVDSITDPAGRVVQYRYDSNNNLTSVIDVAGHATTYTYDASHQMLTAVRPQGGTLTNTYDDNHRMVAQTSADGGTTTWSYGTNETTTTDPAGVKVDTQFQNLLPTSITEGYGTSSPSIIAIAYDSDLNPTTVTDPRLHNWSYGYDGANNLNSVCDPLGHCSLSTYDGNRDLTSQTTPSGHTTTYTYDSHGNMTGASRTLSPGNVEATSMSYNPDGTLASVTDPLQKTTNFGYDTHGDPTSVTTPLGHKTTATFDTVGGETSITSALGNVTGCGCAAAYTTNISLDAFERPQSITDAAGNSSTFRYDNDGNLTDATDRDGRHTHVDYTAGDRPYQVTRADGVVLKSDYYSDGTLKSQTNGAGKKTSYTYDSLGRPQSITDPLGRSTSESYDANGNLHQTVDSSGRTTTYSYDNANRLTAASFSSGSPGDISYSYNQDNLMTGMTDDTGSSSYSYDSFDRLTSQTDGNGQSTGYSHDIAGQTTGITYPGQTAPVALGYDDDGNLHTVTDWLNHTTTFDHDAAEQLTAITRPNGTSASYGYNANGVLTDITELGTHTSLTRSNEGLLNGSSAYDSAGRLTSGGYQYDNADNLTQTNLATGSAMTQTFDDANQLTSTIQDGSTTGTYAYDPLGERTGLTPSTGTASTYSYNQAGELTAYSGPDHSGTGTASVSYTYNGDGQRMSKTVGGTTSNEAWAGGSMIKDGSTYYIEGPSDTPIEQISGTTPTYYSTDQLGSTTALTDSSGSTTATYSYDAYGNQTANTGTASTPFRYAGQYTDPETGLYYLRARYYDPTSGQFLTRDPLETSTRQPYSYANDNPLNFTDPTGMGIFGDAVNFAGGGINTLSTGIGAVGGFIDEGGNALGNLAAGGADSLTFGLSTAVLNHFGVHPDKCSSWFTAGQLAGPIALGAATDGLGDLVLGARAAEEGMAGVRALGAAGEQAAGIIKNTDRIPSLSETAAYRIPDELNATTIGEVKNVVSLSYTNQLRDFDAYARQEGLTFNLYVRGSTSLSGPLQNAVSEGEINLIRNLPG
jgi:RHS repeat-associated protein